MHWRPASRWLAAMPLQVVRFPPVASLASWRDKPSIGDQRPMSVLKWFELQYINYLWLKVQWWLPANIGSC